MPIVYSAPKQPSTGGAGTTDLIPGAGSTYVDVPAGTIVYFFSALDSAEPIIEIGITPGGNEIGTMDLTGSSIASITGPVYFDVTTRVYFTGITPTTQFILKR